LEEQKAAHDDKTQLEMNARKEQYPEEDIDPDEFPDFDVEDFYAKFDEENLPIMIPEEVDEDLDNDFDLKIEEAPAED